MPNTYSGNTEVIEKLLHVATELGGNVQDNVEVCVARCNAVVSEVYSPPRVTRAAELLPQLNIDPGLAMD